MLRVNKNKRFFLFLILVLTSAIVLGRSVFYLRSKTSTQAEAVQYVAQTYSAKELEINNNSVVSQISPDGLFLLIVKMQDSGQNQKSVEIFVRDEEKQTETVVFSYQTSVDTTIEIPFNTWSPDNRYFIIAENTPDQQKYLLFKATGELFDESQYIDITRLYNERDFSYSITKITGWASKAYLVVLASNGEKSATYWFDVYSQRFIGL